MRAAPPSMCRWYARRSFPRRHARSSPTPSTLFASGSASHRARRAACSTRRAKRDCASSCTPTSFPTAVARRLQPNSALFRPIIWSMRALPASLRWRARARSQCCCRARSIACARRLSPRSPRCALRPSQWRSRPTVTPALRRLPRCSSCSTWRARSSGSHRRKLSPASPVAPRRPLA